ncbi:MAG: DinB family protein [Candidatus Solibacter usitatus]|nr:DinB family protein [Candidatus Solibacter usitatus]
MVEPWISGSHADVDALLRPLFHSFEHAKLDLAKWTEGLSTEQMWARPMELGPVGFHIRHIAGSSDRLFTYVLGQQLSDAQMAAMKAEMEPGVSRDELLATLNESLDRIASAAKSLDPATLGEFRGVGRKQLPTTVMGLLVHIAEHTQRHVGEAIVTAKVVAKS